MSRYYIDGSGEAEEGITVETSMGMVTVKTDEMVLGELRSTTVVLSQARAVEAARALANAAADLDLEHADPFRPSAAPATAPSLPDPDPTWESWKASHPGNEPAQGEQS